MMGSLYVVTTYTSPSHKGYKGSFNCNVWSQYTPQREGYQSELLVHLKTIGKSFYSIISASLEMYCFLLLIKENVFLNLKETPIMMVSLYIITTYTSPSHEG